MGDGVIFRCWGNMGSYGFRPSESLWVSLGTNYYGLTVLLDWKDGKGRSPSLGLIFMLVNCFNLPQCLPPSYLEYPWLNLTSDLISSWLGVPNSEVISQYFTSRLHHSLYSGSNPSYHIISYHIISYHKVHMVIQPHFGRSDDSL